MVEKILKFSWWLNVIELMHPDFLQWHNFPAGILPLLMSRSPLPDKKPPKGWDLVTFFFAAQASPWTHAQRSVTIPWASGFPAWSRISRRSPALSLRSLQASCSRLCSSAPGSSASRRCLRVTREVTSSQGHQGPCFPLLPSFHLRGGSKAHAWQFLQVCPDLLAHRLGWGEEPCCDSCPGCFGFC